MKYVGVEVMERTSVKHRRSGTDILKDTQLLLSSRLIVATLVDLFDCCKILEDRYSNIIVRLTLYVINRLCVVGYLKPSLFFNECKDKKLLCKDWSSTCSYCKY